MMKTSRLARLPRLPRLLLAPAVAFGGLIALSLASAGCSSLPIVGGTPIYSAQERYARIGRNFALESRMLNDDIDSVFLLRPTNDLTRWNAP